MGTLIYGPHGSEFEFDDRLLAHLRVVIVTKFRRRESFTLSWEVHRDSGGGRISLWLDPSIPLQFHFRGSREPALNREWIENLATIAGTTTGLVPLDEPKSPAHSSVT
ncbi:ATP-dependent DNA ligase [Herbiconiux sp. A18JL235]|uniref:ATP-dependent DNA ligase n=1 Tax=Herbiconiux sp. A18JL235 TaxID=3152363 RepID=A0AB39BD23_9MICO